MIVPRGGTRQGTTGKSYSNRTDLQAVKVGPSQQYGQAVQQQEAQKIIPLPNNSAIPSGQQSTQAPGPLPGDLPGLIGPTARPNEPVTHGAASGLGGGPEVLQTGLPMGSMSEMLNSLARSSNSASLQILARAAGDMGQ